MKSLSEAETYCWNYIQDNLTKIPHLSISTLAQEAHVSLSTVNRTLKKAGYDGYIDFKQTVIHTKNERKKNGFSKEVNEAIHKNEVEITRTINQLSAEDIENVIKLIDQHEDIIIFSTGLSSNVATEMVSKLRLFGKNCVCHDDFDYMAYYANRVDKNCLVVAISVSGETPEIVAALRKAKAHQAKIVVLTATIPSTMADIADVYLSAYKSKLKEINFGIDVGSRIPLQVVNRILLDAYSIYKNLGPIREK